MRRYSLPTLALLPAIALSQQSDAIVRNATAPRYPAGATLVQQAQIGTVDGEEHYLFSNIASVLAARDGQLWVLDFVSVNSAQLRLYSAAGKFVRNVGRQGGGPGEYQGPTGLAQLPDGRVVLRDIRGNRVNVYRQNGDLDTVWTFATAYTWSVRGRDPIRADTSGLVWMPFTPPATSQPAQAAPRFVWVRINSRGVVVDTVWAPELPQLPRPGVTVTQTRDGVPYRSTLSAPFQPGAYAGLNPAGYILSAVSSKYELKLMIPRSGARAWNPGDPVVSVRRDVPPVVVTDAERADHREQLEWDVNRRGGTVTGSMPDIPAVKPYFDGFGYSEDGRILLSVAGPSEKYKPAIPETPPGEAPPRVLSWRETKRSFDVFEPDGSFVGRLDMLSSTRPASMRGNTLWAIYRDPDGVNFLRKYNVLWR